VTQNLFKVSVLLDEQFLRQSKDYFFNEVWSVFAVKGLLGIDEGTVLVQDICQNEEDQNQLIFLDSDIAPRHRDWVGDQNQSKVWFYFSNLAEISYFTNWIKKNYLNLIVSSPVEEPQKDWNAEWKKNFKGILVPPYYSVLPPWHTDLDKESQCKYTLIINPGAGFGTGTHETTQLCLSAIGQFEKNFAMQIDKNKQMLDFGSGSGILAIAGALQGFKVDAIEVDELAIENSKENAEINHVFSKIKFYKELKKKSLTKYSLICANILKPVLLKFSDELVKRLDQSNRFLLVLSGLLENDVNDVRKKYQELLNDDGIKILIEKNGEWRSILFYKI